MRIHRHQTTRKIIPQFPTIEWCREVSEGRNTTGWCIACGEEADCVEPDARKYLCNCCFTRNVYGAEELALMGAVR